jgi:hypothetical protein
VVRDDGGPIRFRHALVRGAIGVVEILMTFGVVACIASLVSARGRRLGDVFAGTLVVRERVAAGQAAFAPPPPPWLAGRFSALDLSAVPDGLWLAVRQYLTRMGQLDPQVGWGMAQRLADDLAARTGAPVPPETPPALYLAAVLQERQAREARRAFGSGAPAGAPAAQAGGAVRAPGGVPAVPAVPTPASPAPAPPGATTSAISTPSVSAFPAPTPPVSASQAPASPVSGTSAPSAAGSPASAGDASRAERPATGFVPPA